MLLRSAAANCMANAEDLSVAAKAFKDAGWQGGDADDGGLAQFTQDEVTADLNVDVGYCAVESSALTFADATAVASDLVTLDAGGKAVVEQDDEGCLDVSSDADPDNSLSITTAGQDPTCKESPGAGVMITVLGGQD
ncbi:MAG: hypothetical protein EBU97_06955 [Rhodobacteraceae bacterium]|nr:hypothetical protein [Paracoccaceae bacterium]